MTIGHRFYKHKLHFFVSGKFATTFHNFHNYNIAEFFTAACFCLFFVVVVVISLKGLFVLINRKEILSLLITSPHAEGAAAVVAPPEAEEQKFGRDGQ